MVREEKDRWVFEVQVYLNEISAEFIQVQIYADPTETEKAICEIMRCHISIPGSVNGYIFVGSVPNSRPHTHFTPRIVAYHSAALTPIENKLVLWWSGTAELHGHWQ